MVTKHSNDRKSAMTPLAGRAPASTGFFSTDSGVRILPFAAYMAFIVIADLLHAIGWTAQELLWLYPVKILVVAALLLCYRKRYIELFVPRMSAKTALVSVTVGLLVFVLWIGLNASWMRIGTPTGFHPAGPDGLNWLLVAFRLAGAALVVPVMEELFWRSFLQRWLARSDFLACDPARVGVKAIVITAVLFGFEHDLWLAGIIAGLFYGLLYLRSGNLWAPIIAHAVTNGTLGLWVLATGSWTYW
jgi:uncharacterized protein